MINFIKKLIFEKHCSMSDYNGFDSKLALETSVNIKNRLQAEIIKVQKNYNSIEVKEAMFELIENINSDLEVEQ